VVELLKEKGLDDVLVVGGGIIPEEDVAGLKKAGVAAVFGPGTRTDEIIKFIEDSISGS
jgi:methylmalonyl-CoA mutase C-terminal domain/subunit